MATALSEDVRDRIGVVALRRHLQTLQREVSAAHERLHVTQASCSSRALLSSVPLQRSELRWGCTGARAGQHAADRSD